MWLLQQLVLSLCVCTMIFRMTRPFYDLSQFELEESSSSNKKIQNLQVKFLLDLNPRLESQKAYSCENSSGTTSRFWYYGQHLSKMNQCKKYHEATLIQNQMIIGWYHQSRSMEETLCFGSSLGEIDPIIRFWSRVKLGLGGTFKKIIIKVRTIQRNIFSKSV